MAAVMQVRIMAMTAMNTVLIIQRTAAEAAGSRMITDAAEARRTLDTHLSHAVRA